MKFALALVFFACIGFSLQAVRKGERDEDGELCNVCEAVATYIKKLIEDNLSKDEIEQKVQAFCEELGGLAGICKDVVIPLIDKGFEDLEKETPEHVCQLLNLCQKS